MVGSPRHSASDHAYRYLLPAGAALPGGGSGGASLLYFIPKLLGLIVPIGGGHTRGHRRGRSGSRPLHSVGGPGGSDFETSAAPSTAHTLVKSAAWGVTHDVCPGRERGVSPCIRTSTSKENRTTDGQIYCYKGHVVVVPVTIPWAKTERNSAHVRVGLLLLTSRQWRRRTR